MPIRVDCDCNVFITCCDGTEKQLLTADQVKALLQQQPGQGAQQPKPGGCMTYQGTLQGDGKFLIPTVVNAGDVITVTKADGLTNDGPHVEWRNYAGDQVFAGLNVGGQITQSTDLLPSAYHLGLLVNIAGVYYPAYVPVTVPSGVSNVQPYLCINTTNPALVAGSLDIDVDICNNQTATWTHVFDFTLSSQGWLLSPVPPGFSGAAGEYVAGIGWQAAFVVDPSGNAFKFLQIVSPIVARTPITSMSLEFSASLGTLTTPPFGDALYSYDGSTITVHRSDPASPVPSSPYAVTIANVPMTQVAFDILVGFDTSGVNPGGDATAIKLTVTGTGTDPF